MLYVDVILPLPLRNLYTYSVAETDRNKVMIGNRVIVQFGKKKIYTAIVQRIYETKEVKADTKEIVSILDEHPIVSPLLLNFWSWISSYYMSSLGEVYKAALPSVLKLESETLVRLNPNYEVENNQLSPKQQNILYMLSATKAMRIADIEKASNSSNCIPAIKYLADMEAVFLDENVKNNYTAKKQDLVSLARLFSEDEMIIVLDSLHKAAKQSQLLITFMDLSQQSSSILKKELLDKANVANSVLNELLKKNILKIEQLAIDRLNYGVANIESASTLNSYQQVAYDEINSLFAKKEVVLLHGVTSSGKTEIYIQLIKNIISQGKQVLYLLPEIALTTQITERLKSVFGNKLVVYHSKFNDNERAEIWNRMLVDDECQVILGARSAIFLPFNNLDLVIVDEEHETSYKQQDPAPRYNARNASIVLANMFKAKVLLGSATPSVESYANALDGRYGLVSLTKRYDDIALPIIEPINVKELRRTKQMKSTILSPPLVGSMRTALDKKEQIILFQNRRGFAPIIECKTCSWTPHCTHCDVSLTYHKGQRMLVCHYCAATYPVPTICPECETPTLDAQGYGTERIEEEVIGQFPDASTIRMDLDTTRSKRAYERIIADFENEKTNILIGTQMVSKGLDFDNVSIVGILNADSLLNYPDFRAHERAFQMMTQVSGRAGRKNKQGHVLLQTSHPSHPIITFVRNNDYNSFFRMQLDERKLFRYPPYFRLIAIIVRGRDELLVDEGAQILGQSLHTTFGERVLGPTRPPISRVQSLYIRKILLKIENNASVSQVRESILYHQSLLTEDAKFKSLLIHYDVDPV